MSSGTRNKPSQIDFALFLLLHDIDNNIIQWKSLRDANSCDFPNAMTLADRVQCDLVRAVETGTDPPFPLTLNGIAGAYGISPMPVRQAVETLVEKRYLLRGVNGRLAINRRRRKKRFQAEDRPSASRIQTVGGLAEKEKEVTRFIVGKGLQGHDDYLREASMVERFQISRSVLRRMFDRLAGEGIIEHHPRCGWKVRPSVRTTCETTLKPAKCSSYWQSSRRGTGSTAPCLRPVMRPIVRTKQDGRGSTIGCIGIGLIILRIGT